MNCKNCQTVLRLEFRFCPTCGAKTEVQRITFPALLRDFIDRFLDLDNSVVRTFTGMILRPEAVIGGYITGLRKRYLNPVSFLGIALTLSGILIFVMQKLYAGEIDFTGGAENLNPEFARKWSNIAFDFNAVLFLLYLPVFALPAYLLMNKVRYNLAEYFVAFVYTVSEYSILSFPFSLALLIYDAESYLDFSRYSLALIFVYVLWVLWRLNRYSFLPFLGRSLVYSAFTIFLFFGLIIGLMVLLLLTGYFELTDFQPVETAQAISSSAMNWAS
ncbi:DUF3667 domain-containing protein [Robiginitalea sp. SC105]|uniref:DUF3667 domain-containing protein n=1 Tax=Robiginitalea sp. SC105 TaxID=2762332 RepID=UPI00163A8D8F|nr:DUF3667 domain-containing protein [Robiginitalea sp. SC105]MBC2839794.1 DUF3667 domain-containing protein [Robiginitalea sp. SC105]